MLKMFDLKLRNVIILLEFKCGIVLNAAHNHSLEENVNVWIRWEK